MGLKKIPVLPEDYPLFDWADWQSSRDALVKGGPTRRFASECWNAIVDTLADALEAAGLEWDPGGFEDGRYSYSVEDIKMDKDKRLKSSSMNRMLVNIERLTRFGWGWDVDPSFRGYTGFSQFRELPWRDGKDKVYPEYIIELVRGLNRTLELMRGTWPITETESSVLSITTIQLGLDVAPAGHIEAKVSSTLNVNPQIELHTSAPIEYGRTMSSKVSAEADMATAVRSFAWVNNPMLFHIQGRVRQALPGNPQDVLVHSKVYADVGFSKMAEFLAEWTAESLVQAKALPREGTATGSESKAVSSVVADLQQKLPLPTSGKAAAFSKSSVRILRREPLPTGGEVTAHSSAAVDIGQVRLVDARSRVVSLSKAAAQIETSMLQPTRGEAKAFSIATVEITNVESQPVDGRLTASSNAAVSVQQSRIRPGWAEQRSAVSAQANVEQTAAAVTAAAQHSKLQVLCTIGSAWDPPIWHDGGLWIRQAYRIKIRPDGSMDLSGTGDAIAAVQPSVTVVRTVLDTAWLPPVWYDGGLYIRQVREVKVLADGSLDLSGAGEKFKVRQSSRTTVSCSLNTAWLPPVMVDGGLFIRQSQEVTQYENGELEVR